MCEADGELFGTLCGIDPQPKPNGLVDELPMIEMLGRPLSSYLASELRLTANARFSPMEQSASFVDTETNTLSSLGWDRIVEAEESRCAMFGLQAYVFAAQLEANARDHVGAAISVIRERVSGEVSIARVDGQILLLIPECDSTRGISILAQLRELFAVRHIDARCCAPSFLVTARICQVHSRLARVMRIARRSRGGRTPSLAAVRPIERLDFIAGFAWFNALAHD
ncbi:MAG: hypothetical protein AB8B91_17260 [Rubripirellula sp.]